MILLEIIILPSNTVLRNPTSEIYLINESDFFFNCSYCDHALQWFYYSVFFGLTQSKITEGLLQDTSV